MSHVWLLPSLAQVSDLHFFSRPPSPSPRWILGVGKEGGRAALEGVRGQEPGGHLVPGGLLSLAGAKLLSDMLTESGVYHVCFRQEPLTRGLAPSREGLLGGGVNNHEELIVV